MKRMELESGQTFELLVLGETIGHTYFICQERRVRLFESGLSGEKGCQTKIVARRLDSSFNIAEILLDECIS